MLEEIKDSFEICIEFLYKDMKRIKRYFLFSSYFSDKKNKRKYIYIYFYILFIFIFIFIYFL